MSDHEGVVYKLLNDIPKTYFDIQSDNGIGQVEILGWMHQYYNTERKNRVIDVIKKNRVSKEDIPFATQLFTTDWVVKYMVDNSLGRYWLERNPDSQIRESLEFLMPGEIEFIDEVILPEDLKIIDNAMGSGHILIYAFDVLMNIYTSKGYSKADAAVLIVEKNLYGLEIDKSSYELAYFALMMKVRQYNKKAFLLNIKNNIEVFVESDDLNIKMVSGFGLKMDLELRNRAMIQVFYLMNTYSNSKEIGSLLISETVEKDLILKFLNDYNKSDDDILVNNLRETIIKLLKINEMLLMKYDIVVTNPPYLNKFSPQLKNYLNDHYNDYKKDLFSAFMYRNIEMSKPFGYAAFMTPFVWMFINSYVKLREYIIENKHLSSLIQMEYSAFDDANVPICTFVIKNKPSETKGQYIKLSDFVGRMKTQEIKALKAINNPEVGYFYETDQIEYTKIPGYPIAYWASANIIEAFERGKPLESILQARQGMATGDNKTYLKLWWEVDFKDIVFDIKSFDDYKQTFKGKYVPYNKGGQRRQWYGNYDYVLLFNEESYNKLLKSGNKLPSRNFYFQEAISWGLITSGEFSIRYRKAGSVHDVSGMSAFSNDHKTLLYILGLLSTPIANMVFKKLNPTLNLQVGDFKNFPVIENDEKEMIVKLAKENVELAKRDWDLWETSWDFNQHALIDNKFNSIEMAYNNFKNETHQRFNHLKNNQESINRVFIDLYKLNDSVLFKVKDKDITMTKIFDDKSDIYEDIKGNWYIKSRKEIIESFISYAVGCMFLRYSPDSLGLLSEAARLNANYQKSYNKVLDNKIKLNKNDIVKRFIDFVESVYGRDNLQANLDFIAQSLNNGETLKVIENYFKEEFYLSHYKTYRQKPIYVLNRKDGMILSYIFN